MRELRRCPFCGGEATTFAGDIDMYGSLMYGVMCKNTACCMIPSKYPSKEAAIEAWNRREPIDKIVEQLEELADEANDDWIAYGREDDYFEGKEDGIREAIEIVEGGLT